MTKKLLIAIAFLLLGTLCIIAWVYLPMEITGEYRMGNFFMRLFYALLISITVTIMMIYGLVMVTRRDYVKLQLHIIKHFRHLLILMVKRDFMTRYRKSMLGVLWSVLNPLLTMIILASVFSMIFGMDTPDMAIYVLSGQLIYNFFSEATTTAMGSVTGGASIIKKVYVPKYLFPVTKVISSAVNLAFAFIAFIVVFLVTDTTFHWTIFLIPIPVLYVFVFSTGVGMILSASSVFFKDVTYLYGVILTMLFFLTPIMYPVSILPEQIFHIIHLNPLFHYIQYFRDLALYGVIPNLWTNIVCIGFALCALSVGLYVKMKQQDKYILHL